VAVVVDPQSLYADYADPLRRYVSRVAAGCGLPESLVDTEGIVHETFVALLGSRGVVENPPAWLFTVARRLVIGRARALLNRWADGDPRELLDASSTRWSSVARQASTEDICEARRVMAGLTGLTDNQRVAVFLRHVLGWSTAEIGEYLACAPATVSVHVHRGRSRLRETLGRIARVLAVVGGAAFAVEAARAMGRPMPPHMPWPGGVPAPPPDAQGDVLHLGASVPVIVGVVLVGFGVAAFVVVRKRGNPRR
jgi:RNA polymerase sigma-70 factor, ECF subfamily